MGRMLIQEGINYNLHINILANENDTPCKHLCNEFAVGNLMEYEAVYNFGKTCDIITIEIEHVNTNALADLEKMGVKVFPQPDILKIIQDKGLQKDFYKLSHIPTAHFHIVNDKQHALGFKNDGKFMMKLRKGGYDGRGVVKLENSSDFEERAFDAPSVLEELIDFEKEISVIVARNSNGDIAHYPPVEMEFNPEVNLVEFLVSPAAVDRKIEEEAIAIARKVIDELKMVGILAVEMFVTKSGKILVNEIAPRPHNSGHQSIEGNFTSQYEQHLRAILNLPLGDTRITFPSVMVNLLGEKGFDGRAKYDGLEEVMALSGVYIHLYGKLFTKAFRKMGHVTVIDKDVNEAKRKARAVQGMLRVIS